MAHELLEHLLEVEDLRLAVLQRHHVDAEHRLHRRVLVQVVQHDVGDLAALELDDDAHAVLVGLVAQAVAGDAVDDLLAHQLGDALEQPRLVHLERQLRDDDGLPALVVFFDGGARAHVQAAAPGCVSQRDPLRAVDDAGGREIRARDVLHQGGDREARIVDQRDARRHDLAEVVRRNVGGHADRDAGGAVDQQVRHARRQDDRLFLLAVVVVDEVDGLLVDVREQLRGQRRHAALGVPVGGRRVAVDRAEIALPVHQLVAHREVLRHAHQRVVGRGVAVRVVFTEHVADHARALHVRARRDVIAFLHREQDAPVHRLQSVADVGQGAPDDDAHRIVEIRLAHLVFEVDVEDFARDFGHAGASEPGKFKWRMLAQRATSPNPYRPLRACSRAILRHPQAPARFSHRVSMEPIDTLITARWIVPIEPDGRVLEDHARGDPSRTDRCGRCRHARRGCDSRPKSSSSGRRTYCCPASSMHTRGPP